MQPRANQAPGPGHFPDDPVLVRVLRGERVESQHRGAWILVDRAGEVLAGAGAHGHRFFARSTIKSLQALPLLETGAAEACELAPDELALVVASHSGEPCHTERVAGLLARLGLDERALACGPQPPMSREARAALVRAGHGPGPLHNNCSGKHAGFLALARHLGLGPGDYLDAEGGAQELVRAAVAGMTGFEPDELVPAVDGCSAPTYRLPLTALARAFARVANPDELAPARRAACERITAAVAAWPELVAGSRGRLCTELSRASAGRLFPKLGGEAVYAVAERGGAGRALAVKIDDGASRGLHAVVVALLERHGMLAADEARGLEAWKGTELRNWAGRVTGRLEVVA